MEAHATGDPCAAYELGTWYPAWTSTQSSERYTTGVALIQEAVAAGVADPLYDLAVMCQAEEGVLHDESSLCAIIFPRRFRENQSIYEARRCYEYGTGMERDREIAAIWRRRATELRVA